MSAAVFKMAATTSTTLAAAQKPNEDDNQTSVSTNEINSGVIHDAGENVAFNPLSSNNKEQFKKCQQQQQHCNVPLENLLPSHHSMDDGDDISKIPSIYSELNDDFIERNQRNKHATVAEDVDVPSSSQVSPGLNLLQQTAAAASSPPPHSYRHSRAYRHFKNPPQPHMCIRTTTETGEELFINVLSWTRIVIPQEPSDPIPLYGGMRVSYF